jgi:hypothetical protein
MNFLSFDRRTFRLFSLLILSGLILGIALITCIGNIYPRAKTVAKETELTGLIRDAESSQNELMNRIFHLTRLNATYESDAKDSSFFTEIGGVINLTKGFKVKLKKLESGKLINEANMNCLPLVLEFSGQFEEIEKLIIKLENEMATIGISGLEFQLSSNNAAEVVARISANLYKQKQ